MNRERIWEVLKSAVHWCRMPPPPARDYSSSLPARVIEVERTYDPASGGFRLGPEGHVGFADVEVEVAKLWLALVRLLKPMTILETGTHRGYSTCHLAAGVRDNAADLRVKPGHIWTIDPAPHDHLWRGSDLETLITFVNVTSQAAFEAMARTTFDMLVLDSDHHYSTIIAELRVFEPQLRVGGHILMHDSLYFDGVGAAVQQLKADPRFEVITLDSPRTGGYPPRRPPGVTIVRKNAEGLQVEVDTAKLKWNVGDPWSKPLLRGGVRSGLEL